nr:serine hydrolase [uncultured Actinoplanes sp.]
MPFTDPEGTRHAYDNATTYVLARMVEHVTGRGLPELLDDRLFAPMGVDHAEWDVVTTPHRVRLHIDDGRATATWSTVPPTGPDPVLHLRAPLMTRPDVA